ncbi:MAG: ABC transporter substrate-binding protein [Holosporaceae bacterium]|jgi:polar amino acid transport system substrate-binding protein|nr:ABC transporter substrate-binding protein [Holosporaceae bacterium]
MKKRLKIIAATAAFFLSGCDDDNKEDVIKFGICADYAPFEYYENGKLTGFDVELAKSVAKKLKKTAEFKDMQFSALIPSLQAGMVDAVISAMAASEDRKKNCDFSDEYYSETFAAVYKKDNPITDIKRLNSLKVACQLGSTMEAHLKKYAPNALLTLVDNNNQAIELLKAGHVDCVFINENQGAAFCEKNAGLAYSFIAKGDKGYAAVAKKGSKLKEEINKALKELESEGEIQKLKQKWIKN